MNRKEVDFNMMKNQVSSEREIYIKSMEKYISNFKNMSASQQKTVASKSLKSSGITTQKGIVKKSIVSR